MLTRQVKKYFSSIAANLMTFDELKNDIESGKIDTVFVGSSDAIGRYQGKSIVAKSFLKSPEKPVNVCKLLYLVDPQLCSVYGYTSIVNAETSFGNVYAHPDFSTIRRLTWLDKTAAIMGNVYTPEGELCQATPRSLLASALEKVQKMDYGDVIAASELEFYKIVQNREQLHKSNFTKMDTRGTFMTECCPEEFLRDEQFNKDLINNCLASSIPISMYKGEGSPGQEEMNLDHGEVMSMCDNHVFYKMAVKHIAAKHGFTASFMAKPFTHLYGNSCHIHISLLNKEGKNVFAGTDVQLGEGVTCSKELIHFLGGWMKFLPDTFFFYAPFVNSYKRLLPGTFAPNTVTWGYDNRTTAFRVIDQGEAIHIENRLPGADTNPYLAYTATILSGLKGIQDNISPPSAYKGCAYDVTDPELFLPFSIIDALDKFENSKVCKDLLGEETVKHHAFRGRAEAMETLKEITDVEVRKYLEVV